MFCEVRRQDSQTIGIRRVPSKIQEFSFDVAGISHTYACSTREILLTSLYNRLDEVNGIGTDFPVRKASNHRGEYTEVVLRVRSASLVKMVAAGVRHERQTASSMKKINLVDVMKIETAGERDEQVLLHTKSRVWQLLVDGESDQFASTVQRNAKMYLQKHIPVQRVTGEEILIVTNARAESLRASPVLYEFSVVKNNDPASGMQRERTLVLTKEFMAEMTGSHVIALHSLSDILGLVVSDKNESEVIVELSGWRATQYCVADREALVGSLAEVASHAKARNFSVRLEPFAQHTLPEKPLPLYQNEYEIYLIARFMTVFLAHRENLSGLTQADVVAEWLPMVKEYACNMHPGDSLCIDARPMLAVAEMLRASLDLKPGLGASYAVTCCSVVQRLLGTRGVFESVKSNPDFIGILIKALKHPSSVVAFAAANTIRAAIKHYSADSPAPDSPAAARASTTSSFLMQAWPAHAEAANKHVVLSGDNLQVLVARLQTDALVHQNALQVQGILEILTLALHLPPSSDAEAEKHWMETLESSLLVAADVISAISRSRSNIMYCSNALLIKTIFTRCSPAFITRFRAVILSRAVVLLLLKNALFNKLERARDVSAELLFLIAESDAKTQQLLANLLPKVCILSHAAMHALLSVSA
ncbi:unnamed protein product [Closterium sp. NIES-53]